MAKADQVIVDPVVTVSRVTGPTVEIRMVAIRTKGGAIGSAINGSAGVAKALGNPVRVEAVVEAVVEAAATSLNIRPNRPPRRWSWCRVTFPSRDDLPILSCSTRWRPRLHRVEVTRFTSMRFTQCPWPN